MSYLTQAALVLLMTFGAMLMLGAIIIGYYDPAGMSNYDLVLGLFVIGLLQFAGSAVIAIGLDYYRR